MLFEYFKSGSTSAKSYIMKDFERKIINVHTDKGESD